MVFDEAEALQLAPAHVVGGDLLQEGGSAKPSEDLARTCASARVNMRLGATSTAPSRQRIIDGIEGIPTDL